MTLRVDLVPSTRDQKKVASLRMRAAQNAALTSCDAANVTRRLFT